MLDVFLQELRDLVVMITLFEGVPVVLGSPVREVLQIFRTRYGRAHQGSAFQLELILVRRSSSSCGCCVSAWVGDARDIRCLTGQMARVWPGHALAVDDVHPRTVRAECDVVRLVRRWDQSGHLVRLSAGERN